MKHTAGLSITLAAIWVLSRPAILEPRTKEAAPQAISPSEISSGYALLYDLVSKENQSTLLSIIKNPRNSNHYSRESPKPQRPRPKNC